MTNLNATRAAASRGYGLWGSGAPAAALARRRRQERRAYTLVELLVVIAISSIIMFLLFGPIIQSFNFTRRARAISQAQDAARFGINRLVQEIASASYIYDNGGVKVSLPMEGPAGRNDFGFVAYNPAFVATNPVTWPQVSYARIDLVPSGTRDPGGVIDPTTGVSVQGVEVRPLTRGRRVVRYFVALRDARNDDGSQRFYENVYEFRRDDNDFNPLVVFRAEYDPVDPKLFNLANYTSANVNSGGFNDPNFFYNTAVAPNGQTYGANWQAISRPIVNSQNLDLTIWNRDGQRRVNPTDPFKVAISFSPSAVVGDTGTPGFLSNEGAEQPFAIPTLYSAKYNLWTYPYRITFLRGATTSATGSEARVGELTIEVTSATGSPTLNVLRATGSLAIPSGGNLYTSYSPTTGKIFVKTPNLAFILDPARGRIEAGLPPIQGDPTNGTPYIYPATGGAAVAMVPGGDPLANLGDLALTRFRVNTRDPQAGVSQPTNQGRLAVDLFQPNYVQAANPTVGVDGQGNGTLASPMGVFGLGTPRRGILVAVGTETVQGPDNNEGSNALTPYFRTPALDPIEQKVGVLEPQGAALATQHYQQPIPARTLRYRFDYDLLPDQPGDPQAAFLQFDVAGQEAIGLLARRTDEPFPTSRIPEKFLEASYLWQNNYARDPASNLPLDARGNAILMGSTARPEPDAVKLDYATRLLFNISFGARVYDVSSAQPYSITISDKVQVNNVGR